MSIRFIIGRAGSGKTFRCLEQIRARLRQDAARGSRLLLLVPEQASFQMERALIETPDISGYTRCEVVSFQRLAHRILTETGADPLRPNQTIGSLGRLMLIRRLIRHERTALPILKAVADKPGLIRQVAVAIEELMREDVAPETLALAAERSSPEDPLQAAKLADLTRLYRAYLDSLAHDRLDPAQHLHLAAERLGACSWAHGAEVWVDGFAGFTGQEYHLLMNLAVRAANMEIALLADPDTNAATLEELPAWSFSVFSKTERTMIKLRQRMSAAGLSFDPPIRLNSVTYSRFEHATLARLEQSLFERIESRPARSDPGIPPPSNSPPCGTSVSPVSFPLHCGTGIPPVQSDGTRATTNNDHAVSTAPVSVLALPDRRCEVDAAIAEIERLRREASPPLRYRDVAIIVRDLAPYHDLISAAMRAHDIPCFIDRRRPTTHHPLVELVRGLLAVAADDCGLESVRLLLKTGLLPIAPADADLLENYLLAHGINGRSAWDEPWTYTRMFRHKGEDNALSAEQVALLARVNAAREQWRSAIGGWLNTAVGDREDSGENWARALYRCLEHLRAAERVHGLAAASETAGQPEEADAHRQVWADFVELLDEFVRALAGERMKLREFAETLEAGLAEFNLGLAPATLDQVLVGAIERSRHPPVRVVILLGFDDRHFPMRRTEDPLLGDAERRAIERAGAEIGPPRDQQLLDERMLAYIALTRASERVVITFPRSESDGKPVQPSPYLRDALAALPGLEVLTLADPRVNRSTEWVARPSELAARLARELRDRPELAEDSAPDRRAYWNALYETARTAAGLGESLCRSLAGLRYNTRAELAPGQITRLIGPRLAASVSRLERFAACPFAHYVEYLLRLEPRPEADMGDVDLGNLCHAILEKFIGDLAGAEARLADLEDDDIAARVESAANEIVPLISNEMMLSQARNAFLLSRGREHLRRVLRWQRNSARVGRYRPHKVEFPFGYPGSGEFRLITPKQREVLLRGRIDRVDLADLGGELLGVVIDYKHTTDRRLDLAKAYHGLTLQLVGYLLAVQQAGASLAGRPVKPVAAFYLPLLEPYQTVHHPSEEKRGSYQWRGIADVAALPSLDETVEPGGGSQYLAARLTKSGEPYETSDLARTDDFAAVMRHTKQRLAELADRLIDGDITVSPYRLRLQTPCSWCEYRPVCRYEIENQPPRHLEALPKADVLARIRATPPGTPQAGSRKAESAPGGAS